MVTLMKLSHCGGCTQQLNNHKNLIWRLSPESTLSEPVDFRNGMSKDKIHFRTLEGETAVKKRYHMILNAKILHRLSTAIFKTEIICSN